MANYKLTYFDIDGGRGEPIRIAFHAAGVEFEDHRISFQDFGATRDSMRFKCSPELEIDGSVVTQSNGMCRYVGKMANLYPTDPLQALYCDEAMGAIEDLYHQQVKTMGLQGDALREAREELAGGWMTVFLGGLDEILTRGGGEYFADQRLTMADLKVFVTTRSITSGMLDHIPTDLVERVAPGLVGHAERVANDPIVKGYYDSRA